MIWTCRKLFVGVLALCGLAAGVHAAENDPPRPAPIAAVLLLSGEKVGGSVLNTNFTWRTPYAKLVIQSDLVSELDLLPAPDAVQRLVSVGNDRVSGLMEDEYVLLRTADGENRHIRRETIANIAFRAGVIPAAVLRPAMVFRFRNGDLLQGELALDSLPIAAAGNASPSIVPVTNVFSAAISASGNCIVKLKDGDEVRGSIAAEELTIRLAIGPTLVFHPASLNSVESHEALELRSASTTRENIAGPHGLDLVWIRPGEFLMGSPQEEPGRDLDEGPQTRVQIQEGFWMAKHEVTQDQFLHVVGANPSSAGGANLPVEKVNWLEAMEFCRLLNRSAAASGTVPQGYAFRLPTEAEWEYACRAGTSTRFSHGSDPNGVELERFAWFTRNGESTTHPVGTRLANPWGLHDMHGNVWEWCLDRFEGALPGGSLTNRAVMPQGNLRVARGGSWLYEAKACRSANRDDYSAWNRCADVGFRVVLAPAPR